MLKYYKRIRANNEARYEAPEFKVGYCFASEIQKNGFADNLSTNLPIPLSSVVEISEDEHYEFMLKNDTLGILKPRK